MNRRLPPLLRLASHGLLAVALLLQASVVLGLGGPGRCSGSMAVASAAALAMPAGEAPTPCHPSATAASLPAGVAGTAPSNPDCPAGGSAWCAWACSLLVSSPPTLPPPPALLPAPPCPDTPAVGFASRTLTVLSEPPRA